MPTRLACFFVEVARVTSKVFAIDFDVTQWTFLPEIIIFITKTCYVIHAVLMTFFKSYITRGQITGTKFARSVRYFEGSTKVVSFTTLLAGGCVVSRKCVVKGLRLCILTLIEKGHVVAALLLWISGICLKSSQYIEYYFNLKYLRNRIL